MMSGPSPLAVLEGKATQDLLDRLVWLEKRLAIADARIGYWQNERVDREEQIADVTRALLDRGIVNHGTHIASAR